MANVTIAGASFEIPDDPTVAVGVSMTEGHVSALQQARRESLRNTFAGRVREKVPEGGTLHPSDRDALQTDLDAYANAFEFGVRKRRASGPRIADPVEREAMNIAKSTIAMAYQAKYASKIDAATLKEKATELLASPRGDDYRKRARAVLKAHDVESGDVLDSLGLAA